MEYEIVNIEEKDGFTLTLSFTPEHDLPFWDFETEEEREELFRKIDNGSLLWFIAKLECFKEGVFLSNSYLCGCCYESIESFLTDGYYSNMVNTVIEEAKQKIKELNDE